MVRVHSSSQRPSAEVEESDRQPHDTFGEDEDDQQQHRPHEKAGCTAATNAPAPALMVRR